MPRTHHNDRGAALVELAFVLPLLAMLIFGILTGGAAYEQKLGITSGAREGARYGASLAQDQIFTSGTWACNVRQVVINRASGDLNGSTSTVCGDGGTAGPSICVSLVEGTSPNIIVVSTLSNPPTANPATSYTTNLGADGATPTPCDTTENYPTTASDTGRRVQVRVSRSATLQAVAFSMNLTLTARATSRYETAGAT